MHRFIILLSATAVAFAEAAGPGAPAAPVAPGGAAPAAQGAGSILPQILLMAGIFAFMYFVLIRPQKKEEQRRKEMLAALKRGDEVLAAGGIHGVIEAIGETTIDVRIGSGDKTLVVTVSKLAVNLIPAAAKT